MKKEYRIKQGSDIEAIMKLRQTAGNRDFVVYKRENHGQSHFRFAVSVPKKYGKAVKRNRMKRQIRAIVAELDIVDHVDIFIVVKPSANTLEFAQIKDNVTRLMDKLKILR